MRHHDAGYALSLKERQIRSLSNLSDSYQQEIARLNQDNAALAASNAALEARVAALEQSLKPGHEPHRGH